MNIKTAKSSLNMNRHKRGANNLHNLRTETVFETIEKNLKNYNIEPIRLKSNRSIIFRKKKNVNKAWKWRFEPVSVLFLWPNEHRFKWISYKIICFFYIFIRGKLIKHSFYLANTNGLISGRNQRVYTVTLLANSHYSIT